MHIFQKREKMQKIGAGRPIWRRFYGCFLQIIQIFRKMQTIVCIFFEKFDNCYDKGWAPYLSYRSGSLFKQIEVAKSTKKCFNLYSAYLSIFSQKARVSKRLNHLCRAGPFRFPRRFRALRRPYYISRRHIHGLSTFERTRIRKEDGKRVCRNRS